MEKQVTTIDLNLLVVLLEKGADELAANQQYINELNVFPVPDGDTGTNMKITIKNALDNAKQKLTSTNQSIFDFGKLFCRELLMHARGNSGVIFSQIFRGFFSAITPQTNAIDVKVLQNCLNHAQKTAYRTVTNPTEGTILTCIRLVAEKMLTYDNQNLITAFQTIWETSNLAVQKTPELLPVLKAANVVDSGAYGLFKFWEGMYFGLLNYSQSDVQKALQIKQKNQTQLIHRIQQKEAILTPKFANQTTNQPHDTKTPAFGYCCEFIIQKNFITHPKQNKKLRYQTTKFEQELLNYGESLVLVNDLDITKVHIHSFFPPAILAIGQKYGEFIKVKIENMTLQYLQTHQEISAEKLFSLQNNELSDQPKVVITCPTSFIFKYLQNNFAIDQAIITNQAFNPSINEIVQAVNKTNSSQVLFLADNPNILLAANEAKKLLKKNKVQLSIVKTTNIMEIYGALLAYDPAISAVENSKKMQKALKKYQSATLFQASKTTKMDGYFINKEDYVVLANKRVLSAEKTCLLAFYTAINNLLTTFPNTQSILCFYGKKVSYQEVKAAEKHIMENYGIKCEMVAGKQNLYHFYFGLN